MPHTTGSPWPVYAGPVSTDFLRAPAPNLHILHGQSTARTVFAPAALPPSLRENTAVSTPGAHCRSRILPVRYLVLLQPGRVTATTTSWRHVLRCMLCRVVRRRCRTGT